MSSPPRHLASVARELNEAVDAAIAESSEAPLRFIADRLRTRHYHAVLLTEQAASIAKLSAEQEQLKQDIQRMREASDAQLQPEPSDAGSSGLLSLLETSPIPPARRLTCLSRRQHVRPQREREQRQQKGADRKARRGKERRDAHE